MSFLHPICWTTHLSTLCSNLRPPFPLLSTESHPLTFCSRFLPLETLHLRKECHLLIHNPTWKLGRKSKELHILSLFHPLDAWKPPINSFTFATLLSQFYSIRLSCTECICNLFQANLLLGFTSKCPLISFRSMGSDRCKLQKYTICSFLRSMFRPQLKYQPWSSPSKLIPYFCLWILSLTQC